MHKLHEAASLLKAADSSSGRQLIFKNLLCAYFLFTACKTHTLHTICQRMGATFKKIISMPAQKL
jgi:hypothetical protein